MILIEKKTQNFDFCIVLLWHLFIYISNSKYEIQRFKKTLKKKNIYKIFSKELVHRY